MIVIATTIDIIFHINNFLSDWLKNLWDELLC